jgi:hypothetical protein
LFENAQDKIILAADFRSQLLRRVEHIGAAAFALLSGDLPLTTGLHIPVDGGVAAAFLR